MVWTAHFGCGSYFNMLFTQEMTSDVSTYHGISHGDDYRNIDLVCFLRYSDVNDPCTLEILLNCIKDGVDVNEISTDGLLAPLIVAAGKHGSIAIMEALLDHGALMCSQDQNGNTALMEAIRRCCSDNALFLLSFNTETDFINIVDDLGMSALSLAVSYGNFIIAKELVARGADINVQDINGNTPILHALWNFANPDVGMVATLLDAGCDVNHQNNKGITPLMLAASHFAIVQMDFELGSGARVTINHEGRNSPNLAGG
jgi:uncharacterized protein